MDIQIRRLTPDLAEDYVRFFDVTPHNVNTGGGKCYCVTWRSDGSYAGNGDHWFSSCEERRERALQFVREGHLQGYLAYRGDEIVGWCNANADCQLGVSYLRSFWPIEEPQPNIRIKSVFCFVVAPAVQRMGVATKLLKRVCEDAAIEGFDYVEAYVEEIRNDTDEDFRGHLAMYDKCGFYRAAERDGRVVVRKALKNIQK